MLFYDILGRGCELLKTVSTRISTFSSNTGDVLAFSEFSTSPTGSENHLASFRFQNTFLLNV